MQKYNTYKESGIERVGEIPEHWEVMRMKYLTDIGNGKDHKGVWDNDGPYSILGSGGEFGRANEFLYDKPSVILGRKGTIDKPMFIDEPFWAVDTAYFTMSKEYTDTKYLFYLCKTINFDLYKYGSAVPSVNQEELKEISFSIPPTKSEQTQIATYLDRKTTEIDQLIADKKGLVKLYKEEKTAVINQAVTKGINPDFKMKDSGIEWLGEIPEHWVTKPIKIVSSYFKGMAFKSQFFEDKGVPIIKASNIKKTTIKKISSFINLDNQLPEFERVRLRTGDIIVSTVGSKPDVINSAVGQIAYIDEEFSKSYLNQNTICIRSQEDIKPKFLKYICLSNYMRSRINSIALWIANQAYIEVEKLRETHIPIPILEEQIDIIENIEEEHQVLDSKISKAQKYIDLLTEYRTALISEVVTGKVKVIDDI